MMTSQTCDISILLAEKPTVGACMVFCGTILEHTRNIISLSLLPSSLIMQPPARPPKVKRSPPHGDAYNHATGQEGMMGLHRSSQNAASRQQPISPDSAVADQSGYEPLQIYQHLESQIDSEVGQVYIHSNHYSSLKIIHGTCKYVYIK